MSSFWSGKSVLITGAAGFLGTWLTETLQREGADVVALVRDWKPESSFARSKLADRVRLVRGDLCDASLMQRTLAGYDVEVVFHLAAEALVGTAEKSPVSTFESNVRGTWTLLEAARIVGARSVVVASSDKAYGHHRELPYLEDFPMRPRFPYEASKACTDLIAQSFAQTFALPIGITRCANLYGGGDLNWSRLVPGTIRSALRGERPIIRSDGTLKRDYLYVADAVAGYLALAEAVGTREDLRGQAFNFGSGTPASVLEATNAILVACGRTDLEPDVLGKPLREIQDQYVGSEKAKRVLGWAPRHSLADGLSAAAAWYRDYLSARP